MASIFLHIGAHKTGTSYLQSLFYRNRARLAAAGIHYPDIGPNEAHHVLAAPWITLRDVPDSFFGVGGADALWDRLITRYAKAPGLVFLSAENLSRAHPEAVDFADLARRLSDFDEVRVIYTLRAQAELVQSLWLQTARSGRAMTLRPYVARAFDKRLGGGVPIDHGNVYEALLRGFDPQQIILLDYAGFRRAKGGMAQVFLDLMGAGLNASDLAAPLAQKANISPDPLAFQIATAILRQVDPRIANDPVPGDDLVRRIAQVLRANQSVPTTILARHEYARFHSRFGPGNAALVARVQPWQPGFAFEPAGPAPSLMYRDDVCEAQLIAVAAALYRPKRRRFGLGLEWLRRGLF